MSKRSSSGESSSASGDDYKLRLKRRRVVEFEPVRICSISGVKDIEARVLKAQHYKLCERFRQKEKLRQILEKRVEELEGRQAKDDEVACIINRYWNRLDEDTRLLLQRFDADATLDLGMGGKEEADGEVRHFLAALSNWSAEEVDENLRKRVEFSQRALSKLVQLFDKLVQRNSRLCDLMTGKTASTPPPPSDEQRARSSSPNDIINEKMDTTRTESTPEVSTRVEIGEDLRKYATNALTENARLQQMVTRLQAENHRLSMQAAHHDDQLSAMENRVEGYSNKLEDIKYELSKALIREEKLDYRLAEYVRKEKTLQSMPVVPAQQPSDNNSIQQNGVSGDLANVSKVKLEELQQELDTQTELASSRLIELQEMNEKNKTLAAELEGAQVKMKCVPPELVKSTPDYQALQSNYSCLLEDCRSMRQEIDELKHKLLDQEQAHHKRMEKLKAEESSDRERTHEEIFQLTKQINQFQQEYDNLRIDVETSGEMMSQAAPINENLTAQIGTLKAQNAQLQSDVSRFKRKWTETVSNLTKCRKELDMERKINNDNYIIIKLEEEAPEITSPEPQPITNLHPLQQNNAAVPAPNNGENQLADGVKQEPDTENKPMRTENSDASKDNENLSAENARLRLERDKLKEKLRSREIVDKKERVKFYSDTARLRIRLLEEEVAKLQKELRSAKQEENGLMNEMESTGQALEEMQQENEKLLIQLKESGEANLKMANERIRDTNVQKKMKEEREIQLQLISSLDNQIAAKGILVQKMEEKLKLLTDNKTVLESELRLRDQANDSLRRKALESTQSANDLRLRLDKMTSQFNDLQESISKKSAAYESNFLKIKRLEEDKRILKRQLARLKEMEKFENIDQLLQEENKQLRETLKCPSCKTNPKNAILTKCYHVFCIDCIKKRYDARRRKCPECNCGFGANDFRRVYIQ